MDNDEDDFFHYDPLTPMDCFMAFISLCCLGLMIYGICKLITWGFV